MQHILKILVVYGAGVEDSVDVSVILEGREILPGCHNVAKACALLMGLIYALNLAYPKANFEIVSRTLPAKSKLMRQTSDWPLYDGFGKRLQKFRMELGKMNTTQLIKELMQFGIEITDEERKKFEDCTFHDLFYVIDNDVDGETVDIGLTESMVSFLFEGSFKKQAKFHRFVQQMKEMVTLTLEPVPAECLFQSSAGARLLSFNISPSAAYPALFEVPKFPFDVQAKLDQKQSKLAASDRIKIIRTLYESMAQYSMYPTNEEYVQVAKALILRYPFLKDKEGNGYHTWHMSLKRKFKFERTPLADVEEVKRLKQKFGHSKKVSGTDMDVAGEDATSIEGHVKVLQDQYRKTQPDARIVEERMRRTFAWRRKEIIGGMTVEDAVNKYPFIKKLKLEKNLVEDHNGIDFKAALLMLPVLFREKLEHFIVLGRVDPSSPYPTVQVQETTDWKTVLTRRVTAVIRVDGIEICRASGVDEGVLSAFCAYFVFNLTYPPHLKNTLVFLQRYVLKLTVDGDKPLLTPVTRVINLLQ
ncbi:uncharacterized protein LOC124377327 [Silurus meridionalis]|uniref:uncharacterized protein LOC124377327 n=1 Tax=Silurus meridionalis TaxID=175797 RepID=UPI001EEA8586|nr:uncharacterized protein LOC124377327 [Silurus meridionalis]